MSVVRAHTLLRIPVILSSGLFLVVSIVHGAGRGLSSIPAGYEGLAFLRVAIYAAILVGAVIWPTRQRVALLLLILGIVGRIFLELRTSVIRSWIESGTGFDMTQGLLVALMYVATFVLPLLFLCDIVRFARKAKP